MADLNEKLENLRKKYSEKLEQRERLEKSVQKMRESIKSANRELADISEKISEIETRILAETLRKNGIDVSEVAKAVESGKFGNATAQKVDTYINSDNKPTEKGNTSTNKEETDK